MQEPPSKFKKQNISSFISRLQHHRTEKDVEAAVEMLFKSSEIKHYKTVDKIWPPYLLECKSRACLDRKKIQAASAVAQAVSELHDIFENNSGITDIRINWVLIIDSLHALFIPISSLKPFFQSNKYTFTNKHSTPDPKLKEDIKEWVEFKNLEVYSLTKDINKFLNKLENTCSDFQGNNYMKINKSNFDKIFIDWYKSLKMNESISNTQLAASLFLNEIDKRSKLVEETGELLFIDDDKIEHKININVSDYKNFWGHYSRPVHPNERRKIESFKDRLIHISSRWQTGEFFTPLEIVEKSYEQFCDYYKLDILDLKQYTFWDPCAGRGNLLYGYPGPTYENCFLSTLNQEDVDGMSDGGFYPGATIFQYDWLNQTDEELPEVLLSALKDKNRKWLFVMNPPWGSNIRNGNCGRTGNKEISTQIKELMNKTEISSFSSDLMYQSIFKLINLIRKYNLNAKILLIHNWSLIYNVNNKFRRYTNDLCFKFRKSFIFRGDFHFKTRGLPCCFSTIIDNNMEDQNNTIDIDIFDKTKITGLIKYEMNPNFIFLKKNYPKQSYILKDTPLQIISEKKQTNDNEIVYYYSADMTYTPRLYNYENSFSSYGGYITEDTSINYLYFILGTKFETNKWYRYKARIFDSSIEKLKGDELNTLIYLSLHQTYGRTTSFSQTFENNPVSIRNPLFYLSKSEFSSLPNITRDLYNDCQNSEDSWFVTYLEEHQTELCEPTRDLLNIIKEITKKTIQHRSNSIVTTIKGELVDTQLDTRWDAGWYQIRHGILENTNITVSDEVKELYSRYKVKLKELEEYLRVIAKGLKLTDEVILYDDLETSDENEV